jgi:hypothetical protein
MGDRITARLSSEIPQPDLSRMWDSERTTFTTGTGDGIDAWLCAPDVVIQAHGKEVELIFLAGGPDRGHRKLKAAFERALHRHRPDVQVAWAA